MSSYISHSRFVYTNYDKIQEAINLNIINANDIVLCEDTKEMILIRDDLSLFPVKSKVYRYIDYQSAEESINKNPDTYEGQLVSVLSDKGNYEAYIVNKNKQGVFYITPLNAYNGTIDYDTLGHKPLVNLYGAIGEPIILDQQKDGFYSVNGNYKISDNLDTVFSSMSNNIFIISHLEDGSVKIKKIGADEMIDYSISNDNVTQYIVPTTEWLEEQGYASKEYVDAKIAALDFMTKDDVEIYITEILDSVIDEKISNKFEATTDIEIVGIFMK